MFKPFMATTVAAVVSILAAFGVAADSQGAGGVDAPGKIVWKEDFDGVRPSLETYYSDGLRAKLGIVSDDPTAMGSFLRIAFPGERALEGACLDAKGLPGGRPIVVGARVRGSGQILTCAVSPISGWVYPSEFSLDQSWRTVRFMKRLSPRENSIRINLLSRFKTESGMVVDVDDIRVRSLRPIWVTDAPVGPWRLDLEQA